MNLIKEQGSTMATEDEIQKLGQNPAKSKGSIEQA